MIRMTDETEKCARFISTKQAPDHGTPSMLHEQNVTNLRYILLVNGLHNMYYFDDAHISKIIKGVMLDPMPSFSTLLKDKNLFGKDWQIRRYGHVQLTTNESPHRVGLHERST